MSLLFLALCVLGAFAIQAMTGFGSIVLALTFGALVFDIKTLVPLLVVLNIMMTIPMAWMNRRHIETQLLLKRILPLMLLGLLAGVLFSPLINELWAKLIFAVLIIWVSLRSLFSSNSAPQSTAGRNLTISTAGIVHGLFASGGPLLVYALARSQINKQAFRATLLTLWATLNLALTCWFLWQGKLVGQSLNILILAPCVFVGAWLGNILHHKINEQLFLKVVFSLLLIVGLILLVNSARLLID
ncbi:sulfite exporter TauE/SafE family protein [uncultured Paraglaciecola sp.]|uniref:sulfite exporter TauE/SafE family protein n=1 Tax=uncultured Paraglaciecola sp. TaxID=1765024 RepID=UPI0025EDA7F9|nr:sulfite exporter TauE/SafE family protein [uncultured Paraglaciecola sp.]